MLTESMDGAGQKDYDKQDSEHRAFERLASRLKSIYPKLPICIGADGLYTDSSIMTLCKRRAD